MTRSACARRTGPRSTPGSWPSRTATTRATSSGSTRTSSRRSEIPAGQDQVRERIRELCVARPARIEPACRGGDDVVRQAEVACRLEHGEVAQDLVAEMLLAV